MHSEGGQRDAAKMIFRNLCLCNSEERNFLMNAIIETYIAHNRQYVSHHYMKWQWLQCIAPNSLYESALSFGEGDLHFNRNDKSFDGNEKKYKQIGLAANRMKCLCMCVEL